MSILIFGDAFVDVWMTAKRRATDSAEQLGLPIYDIQSSRRQPGGADNVAENIAALNPTETVVHAYNVDNIPVKSRITVEGEQVCRFDANDQCRSVAASNYAIKGNTVVISDYNKGSITDAQAKAILLAKPRTIWVNSKFPKSNLACMDLSWKGPQRSAENRTSINWLCNQDEYEKDKDFYDAQYDVFITNGPKGITWTRGKFVYTYPALAKNVTSVCGAGDTTLAALVTCPKGWNHLLWAMCAAAIAVESPRTTVVKYDDCVARYYDECRKVNAS